MAILTIHPSHPYAPLRAADLEGAPPHLLPQSVKDLIKTIGMDATLGLLNHWSGVELLNIPKSPHSNPHGKKRWEQLTTVLGNHQAVEAFALAYGGATKFDIPTCSDLRKFRRNEAMRTRFDELIKKGFSSNQAVQDITIEFTPITTRQVQVILNSASHRS